MNKFLLFWIICVILFFYLVYRNYYKIQLLYNPEILGHMTPSNFEGVNEQYYNQKVAQGKEEMSKSKVVICGLLRDAEERIESIISRAQEIAKYFQDYRVLIVENDSKDNTRKKLLEWASLDPKVQILGCGGINLEKCELKLPSTQGHKVAWNRIHKMQLLRNIYLDEVYKNYSNWDYMIVWDLDILGSVYVDGIANSFGHFKPSTDAICANGIYRWTMVPLYYDTYAHRDLIPGEDFHISQKLFHDIRKGLTVRYMKGEPPVRVRSCFGGFAIYRIPSIISNQAIYGTTPKKSGNIECEHVILNKKLQNVYLNPSMLYVVLQNK